MGINGPITCDAVVESLGGPPMKLIPAHGIHRGRYASQYARNSFVSEIGDHVFEDGRAGRTHLYADCRWFRS